MFAGIIEHTSRVLSTVESNGMKRMRIARPRGWTLSLGQSIDVDGICSTVVRFGARDFEVEYMPETLKKTTAPLFAKDQQVNLERSLKYGQRIDGHPVQGHVDATAPVREIRVIGKSREITIKPNATLARQATLHGSIAINGVSLTIAKKHGPNLTVALIPHTLRTTNLSGVEEGDQVNVEFDHSADYLAALKRK